MNIAVTVIFILYGLAMTQALNSLRGQSKALKGRNQADALAKVDALIGSAKECALFNEEADIAITPVQLPSGAVIACGGKPPTAKSLTSEEWKAATTINCLGSTIKNTKKVTIEVTGNGQMRCKP